MDCNELDSPPKKMAKLEEKETKSRPLAPVILKKSLESLLNVIEDVCKKRTEDSMRTELLYSKLTNRVMILLKDKSINDWEPYMHIDVKSKCEKVVDLCVYKMDEDLIAVLQALALVLNPNNEFYTFNATRPSESVPPGTNIPDKKLYARPPADPDNPQGWLVDLINRFGDLGGFVILLSRFQRGHRSLTIDIISSLLRPFELCHELLTMDTISKYLMPIVERVQVILDGLTDKELNNQAISMLYLDHDLSRTFIAMKSLVSRVPEPEKIIQNFDSLQIRITFKIRLIDGYFEESSGIFDFDLSLENWDYVLEYFQTSWRTANEKTRQLMLKILNKLAKEYKGSPIMDRILALLWDVARSDEESTEIMDQALSAHVDALTYLNPQNRNKKIFVWLDKCIEELQSSAKWSFPALRQIREIFQLYEIDEIGCNEDIDLETVIRRLQRKYNIMDLVMINLMNYLDQVRQLVKENPDVDETKLKPDGRYNHEVQVEKRLDVLTYLVRYGEFLARLDHVKQIWQYLVEQPVFISDRERCFQWFSEFDEPHIHFKRTLIEDLFTQNILQLDPTLLTKNGIKCFGGFVIDVNKDDEENFNTDNLIGKEYLWNVVTSNPEEIARLGFSILNTMNKNAGMELKLSDAEIHSIFIAECRNQLQIHSDTLSSLTGLENFKDCNQRRKDIVMKTRKMGRIMKFMEEYINACGWEEKN